MTDHDKAALIAELEQYAPLVRAAQPGDLTIEDVMLAMDIGRDAAARWIARLVKQRKLTKHPAIGPSGKRINVYRKVEV